MSDASLLLTSRKRVVWTLAEKKAFDRLARIVNAHGDKLQLICGAVTCPEQKVTLARDATHPGGMVLRCGCSDREFSQVH